MISVTDLRSGIIFEDQGQLLQVLSYEHIKMGRGSATIKVRARNIRTGAITDKSFINGARVQEAQLVKKDLQFLYKDEGSAHFMNPTSYDQLSIPLKLIPEHAYLKEGENFSLNFLEDEVLSLNLPPKMELAVAETGPSIRGNSTSNIYKDAVLENGIKTKIPLFVNTGDRIRIDTRTGEYSEKV